MIKKIKKQNIAIFLFFLLIIPTGALAADYNYGYYGTTTSTASNPLYANSSNGDAAHWFDVSVAGSGQGYVVWGKNDGTGHLVEMSRNAVPADMVEPPGSGAIAFWLESTGGEIHATIGHTNNTNNLTVYFTDSSGGTGGGGSGSCDACQVFSCPGWSQYMSGLEDIKNAIPPAPNWPMVANTFRDTIAPRMISDLSNLLGSASDPPSVPAAPSSPNLLSDLDNHGLAAPTGQEDPGLGSSTFSSDDIKNGAPVIQERQDPTGGGFSILDPISGLPSQDEFKKNKPNEGTANLPGNPKEGDNVAPTPPSGDNIAPKPPDTNFGSPGTPKDGDSIAPKPPSGDIIAPYPGGTGGGFDTWPMPKNDGSTAPLPNESGSAPIPAKDNSTAPIPRQ